MTVPKILLNTAPINYLNRAASFRHAACARIVAPVVIHEF
jgi:hypothetical protein